MFCQPDLGTPLDPSKLSREYMRPSNPAVYVQMRAGHSQGSITERYVHAAQVLFPAAAERGEDRIFSAEVANPVAEGASVAMADDATTARAGAS